MKILQLKPADFVLKTEKYENSFFCVTEYLLIGTTVWKG
jgi:hypothetical protein